MSKINLFVEGKTDKEFIQSLLKFHFPKVYTPNFYVLDGNYTRLHKEKERLKEGKINLIILDSDRNTSKNVTEVLKPFITDEKSLNRDLRFDLFLIENNLEDLIRKISPPKKESFWKCIDQYSECNSALDLQTLRKVDSKAKVYIYVNAHSIPNNSKNRFFLDKDLWDLEGESLIPLLTFLQKHLPNEA